MVDPGSFGLLQTPWREHVSTSDHDELGKVVPGQTMQLDALPEELIDGIVGGESSGYQLADEGGAGVSAPPPLPPGGSGAPPPAAPPAAAGEGSKKTMILAIVVAVLMAVAGVGSAPWSSAKRKPRPRRRRTSSSATSKSSRTDCWGDFEKIPPLVASESLLAPPKT